MRVSLHRRRHESLPPQPRRSPRVLIIVMVLCSAGVGLAAANLGDDSPPPAPFDPAVASAEQASHDVVDERVRAHLRRLR